MTAVSHRPSDARIGGGFAQGQFVHDRRVHDRRVHGRLILAALVLSFTALTLVLNAGVIGETLHGRFADPDDAMRLVQVRAWLAGQSWFDLTATRLDPPHGSFMHWSRLVDLPMAALIRLFGLMTDQSHAERLAAIAVPTLWLAALYGAVARLATILVGRSGRLPALLGLCASGAVLVQFAPGRIGHHAPETIVLVFAVGSAMAALDPHRARHAFGSGVLVGVSLALSLETLPFDVVLAATLAGFWLWRGPDLAATLAWFGAGLLVALPPLFLITVGPGRWGTPVCDAYGAAHLGAGLIGGAGAVALGLAGRYLRGWTSRFAAAVAVAGLVLAYVALAYPACLHSPFAAVDPLVRDLWLSHVVESQPLPVFLAGRPMVAVAVVMPIVLGLVGGLLALASIAPLHPLPLAGYGTHTSFLRRGPQSGPLPPRGEGLGMGVLSIRFDDEEPLRRWSTARTPTPNLSPSQSQACLTLPHQNAQLGQARVVGGEGWTAASRLRCVNVEALAPDVTTCLRLALVAILSAAGLALAFWQVRVLASITPIALCGGVAIVALLANRLRSGGHGRAAAFAPLAILLFASTPWLLLLPEDVRTPSAIAAASAKSACLAPEALKPLAALPSGSIVAPMDSGSHILEATRLAVFAAPYHRNDDGNRFAFEVFLAAPDAARGLLTSRHVTYVSICPGMADIERLVARAPDGLAAHLAKGRVPGFLTPVPITGTPYRAYAVAATR